MAQENIGYAGDVSAEEAWQRLAAAPEATLIDVRTQAEWTYVGIPHLGELGKETVLIEWQQFPSGAIVPDFARRLAAELEAVGIGNDAPLYFICRSGVRSRAAAIAMTNAGFTHCYNVAPGFEGPLDQTRHRNAIAGWKVAGLPWIQT